LKSCHVAIAPCAIATILLGANVAAAEPSTHRADYRVAYIGLPVARATFTTVFDGDRFTVAGEMQSAGVANIVGRTTGSTTVSGVKANDRMQAERYVVAYSSGNDEQRMEVDFDNGSVTSAILTPEKKRTREDWVPVPESDMRAVLDPIAGVMIPEGSDVCDRTLPIFDGETRYDIHLNEAGTQPFQAEGYDGTPFAAEAIVCTARAEPKSGYHARNSSIQYMREMNVEVWFAHNEQAGIYAPVYARVPTKLGPVTITATHFGS
jgi:hypothetical protein